MKEIQGVVSAAADGSPIVTAGHVCSHWKRQPGGLLSRRECWYCIYADFRKRTDVALSESVCRCPENRSVRFPGSGTECPEGQGGKQHA